jgi:hypothetical protein
MPYSDQVILKYHIRATKDRVKPGDVVAKRFRIANPKSGNVL